MSEYAEYCLIVSLEILSNVSAYKALEPITPINLLYFGIFIGVAPIK